MFGIDLLIAAVWYDTKLIQRVLRMNHHHHKCSTPRGRTSILGPKRSSKLLPNKNAASNWTTHLQEAMSESSLAHHSHHEQKELLLSCLHEERNERPDEQELLSNDYFRMKNASMNGFHCHEEQRRW